jgi:hypothetical protein
MKAQVDSSSRGQKDFICREEKRRGEERRGERRSEEKRKDCMVGSAEGLGTGDSVGQVGDWVL